MAAAVESAHRSPHPECPEEPMGVRTVPILTPTIKMSAPSPSGGEPMELGSPTNSSAPPSATKSPDEGPKANGSRRHNVTNASAEDRPSTMCVNTSGGSTTMPAPAAAAAAVHQPKIVQTAFIHKLYNMLEDPNIQHLISWSQSQESFVMSPSHDFSKVLAQYFKHTNISSFVRQLNMYGFHKVSDVFHTGSPDSTLWEFKHGNGNFKRGDLVGLREIKRRASRHALVHREPYVNPKSTSSQPGTPAEPMQPLPEGTDPRVTSLEHNLYDLSTRLRSSEENAHYMHAKQQAVMDTVSRLLHINQELSRNLLSLVPGPDHPVHRDVVALQDDIRRHADLIRTLDEPHEPPFSNSRQYFSHIDNPPVSPRQLAQDDARRASYAAPQPPQYRSANNYRPTVPSNLSVSTRRPYGSIGGSSTTQSSPSSLRPQPPPPPPVPHPLTTIEPPPGSLARRHTSADIRDHGWQPGQSPLPSGPPSAQWPSSPSRPDRLAPEDQRIRESFSNYSIQAASQPRSRPQTPPAPPFTNGAGNDFGGWTWSSASRSDKSYFPKDISAPPTRRGSMAHILNPTDTAERPETEVDPRGDDDRKRKRLQ